MSTGNPRPRVGIFGLTGCAGDQLQILNCEDQLLELARDLDIVDWVMAKSDNDHTCALDVAFVEGVVATDLDLECLKSLRERAGFLVAIGTCAVWGGLPSMLDGLSTSERSKGSAGDPRSGTLEARPASDFVSFDYLLPGCPIEREEFLALVRALLLGTTPELPSVPVCWECKTQELPCRVIFHDEVCCGSLTRGGCGARCPGHGVACAGCRGPVEEPHYDAAARMFADRGLSWQDIAARMRMFSAPAWMSVHLEKEAKRFFDD